MQTDRPGGAPPRTRLRLSRRNLRRAGTSLATLAVAALLAGCGTASSSPSSSSTTPGASTTSTDQFNPALVPNGGSAPGTKPNSKSKTSKKQADKGKASSHSHTAGKSPAQPPAPAPGGTSGPSSGSGGSSGPGSGGGSPSLPPPAAPAPPSSGTGPTHTVTVTHTVTHTVTVTQRPNVPSEAGVPSSYRPVSLTHFDAAHGRIGCRIQGDVVRCDLARRVWSAPRRPSSCHAAWAQGLMVGPSARRGYFVCARSSVLDPTVHYIPAGLDDKVGKVTCQVRNAGVTCFEPDRHGFFIGRTGYKIF